MEYNFAQLDVHCKQVYMCPATTTQSIGRGGYNKMHIVRQVSALNMYEAFLVIHEAQGDRIYQISDLVKGVNRR